jgi:hypothetical protein
VTEWLCALQLDLLKMRMLGVQKPVVLGGSSFETLSLMPSTTREGGKMTTSTANPIYGKLLAKALPKVIQSQPGQRSYLQGSHFSGSNE